MSKKQKATDPARFEGNGISYRAKIIGIEDVAEARGDKMCQETIQKLKGAVKSSGQHKQKVSINVTLEGLKIIDGATNAVLHTHPVHQISFISRDMTDSRAFGYVFGPGDGCHKFFGIKTANSAENVVLALRDLFQTVYEMKKQEVEEAKAKAAAGTESQSEENNTEQAAADTQPAEDPEHVEQVPKNNAPVNPQEQEEAVANLLDLEDQVDTIRKGIEQIKNLDFDDLISEEASGQSPSSTAQTTASASVAAPPSTAVNDPWGLSAPAAASTELPKTGSSSALADLEQLSNPAPSGNPFTGMQAFPAAPASSSTAFFGMAQPGMAQPGMPFGQAGQQGMAGSSVGLPVTKDPFGDPFNTSQAQQRVQAPQMMGAPAGQFGMQPGFSSPFPPTMGAPTPAQPFAGGMGATGGAGMQPSFGRSSPAFSPFGVPAPAGVQMAPQGAQSGGAGSDPFQTPADNLLPPMMPGGQQEQTRSVSPGHADLFGDLLDIKKSAGAESATKSPKEMFQELTQPPKKSLNEIKGDAPAVAPQTNASPFGDSFFSAPINGKPSDAQS